MHLDRAHHLRPMCLTWKWTKTCAKVFHILGLANMRIGQTSGANKTWIQLLIVHQTRPPWALDADQRLLANPRSRTIFIRASNAPVERHRTPCVSVRRKLRQQLCSLSDDRRSVRLVHHRRTRLMGARRFVTLTGPRLVNDGRVASIASDTSDGAKTTFGNLTAQDTWRASERHTLDAVSVASTIDASGDPAF
jgi:hypothetical protein